MIWRVSGAIAALYLIGVIGVVVFRLFGPLVEVAILPPVNSLEVIEATCSGSDQLVRFRLDKRAYSSADNGAELIAFNILDGEDVLPWRRTVPGDESSFSAPAGPQVRGVSILAGCGRSFIMRTRHISPITGLTLPMSWGPFGGDG